MATKDSKTKAFSTTAKSKRKSIKNKKRIRQQIVISIFVVVALILVVFATLIIAQIINKSNEPSTTTPPTSNENVTYIPRDAGNVKMGDLLLINDKYKYNLPTDLSDMINIYWHRRENENKPLFQINGNYSYALTSTTIYLNKETLRLFNQMILDYCSQPDFTPSNDSYVSNLEITLGGFAENTKNEYQEYMNIGKDYSDHILGTTLTLKINNPSSVITESSLKNNVKWIYQNAHKYGFILRYPNDCANHTGHDSSQRIHLRYVGVAHATYIYQNNICLDEYLDLIRNQHGFDNPLEINSADGKTYNVYYVAYSGNPTSVPVPKDSVHTISGDNMNGFIVTVEK